MPQASGSRHSIGYVPEVTFGTTPATPAFKKLRHNSSTINLSKASFQSAELRADRMIADFRHGTRFAEGNVVGELSRTSYDDMLEAALGGTWTANVLKAGTTRKSFTFERFFADITQYFRYTGVSVDTLQVTMNTGGVVGLTFGYWGKNVAVSATPIAGATYPLAPTTAPMDALTGVINEGGSVIAVVTAVTLNLANGLAPRFVIGSSESLEPSIGRSNLTGTVDAYFETTTLYNKFVNETSSSLSVIASDGVDTFTFLVPKLKYSGGDVPVSGEGPVSMSMPFQGLYDPTEQTNLKITRTAA